MLRSRLPTVKPLKMLGGGGEKIKFDRPFGPPLYHSVSMTMREKRSTTLMEKKSCIVRGVGQQYVFLNNFISFGPQLRYNIINHVKNTVEVYRYSLLLNQYYYYL